jgi:peptide/nickel transport system ATP-binding protein
MDTLIEVRDLRVAFRMGAERHEAVRGISFDVPANSTVALVGESGSGKSVSAMSMVRLLPDNAIVGADSKIFYQGRDLLQLPREAMRRLRGKDISVVFQEPMSSLNPVFTVGDQIAEVLRIHAGMTARQARQRALELLDEVGIPEPRARLDAYPHELSGGQQQRVMIAIAIACEPRLLIADEPTTALDVTVQRQVVDLLARLQQRHKMSVLFISHDLGLVGEIAHSVIVMRQGEVREAGPVAGIFGAPRDAYTRALLACRPPLDARPRRLPVIDDIMNNRPVSGEQRSAVSDDGPALIEVAGLRKAYRLKDGLFRHKTIDAVKGADFALHKGRTWASRVRARPPSA